MYRAILAGLVVAILTAASLHAANPAGFQELALGDAAPDFQLPGVDGKQYSLANFVDAQLLLVVFTCNHCPTAQAYEDRIIQLHKDYAPKSVALVAISPNDPLAVRLDELGYTDLGDSFDDMKQRAKDRNYAFPYLYDGDTQQTSLNYGVLATPQVFLFDRERKLRYSGRIDDSDVKTVTSHDARKALDALLAGKAVPVEKTRTFGCSTKWSDKRDDARKSLERWNQEPVRLEKIDAAGLAMLAKNDTPKLLVVNLWASYCGPCISELPELVTMNRMYRKRNFEMITISIDEPEQAEAARKILAEHHVSSTNYLTEGVTKDQLAELLDKQWPGPIPYTILIAPGGKILYRAVNQLDPLEVKRAIVEHLGRTYASRTKP